MTHSNGIERLSDVERVVLAARLRRARGSGARIARRDPAVAVLPLSFGQEQLWFLEQLSPGTATYNIAAAVRLRGVLDRGALERALRVLAARHESLRTSFVSIDGRPRQRIAAEPALALRFDELSGPDAEAELRRLAEADARAAFALEHGPLWRARLIRLGERSHVLVLTLAHIIFDGWSLGVLVDELTEAYAALASGRPLALGELPIQFADYALWERERLRGDTLDALVEHWRRVLADAPVLELATDHPRPAIQDHDGAIERLRLGDGLLDGLRALARRESTTLFVTLLAAVHALLARYSGQDDIVIGTVSANRSRPELAPLIGYLVNTLPIRVDLSGDPSFIDLLARTRAAALEAHAHQDLPFNTLVNALNIPRDPSRTPIFTTGFTLEEPTRQHDRQVAGLTVEVEAVENATSKFDLTLFATPIDDELQVRAEFAVGLFDAGTVRRLLEHLGVLLAGVVADPDRRLSQLPISSSAERGRQLVQFNATARAGLDGCLHERFRAQAARTPDAVAAVLGEQRLSYRELDRHSDRLARRLREHGVSADVLVGVCMQRSLRRLVALLGILKAGGGYVPLDPDYPAERLQFMLTDSAAPVVVTDHASRPALGATSARMICLDRDWDAIRALEPAPPTRAREDTLAYVIYTSGSTGRPKGVMIEHRHAVNFIAGQIERWPIGPGDRILQYAALNFDVSVFDIFCALLSGATLCLAPTNTLLSPPRLAELIRDQQITIMCLPPAVLNLIGDQPFPDLRIVIAGGEAVTSTLVAAWDRPGHQFINGYGPTETSIGATMARLRRGDPDPVPIGRPLPNYRAYVLDRHLNLAPIGVRGELHIGGHSVARGYLNQPHLTRQRFIPDPFTPGQRLYKTGDLARQLPDGTLQFLGRTDHQIKLRGFRIELGEIETALTQHPAVAQATVILADTPAGHQHLIAYTTPTDPTTPPTPSALHHHLTQRLPHYMVPAHIICLDTLPLNHSGKIDRSQLPAPTTSDPTNHTTPQTLLHTILTQHFGTILAHPNPQPHDNFFDLGGNSLQAMQLIAALQTDLNIDTDPTTIFLNPTINQLAHALKEQHGLDDDLLAAGLDELDALSDEEIAALLNDTAG